MASVFFSYAHEDEALRDQLEKQLAILKRQGVIETWHDRRIGAGVQFARAIDEHVETDDIILLLVSPDFLDSDYCYDIEMKRALERHEAGEARVIPVILRACEWTHAPFGKLNAVPKDGRPVTLSPDKDSAFLEVAQAVRAAAEGLATASPSPSPRKKLDTAPTDYLAPRPRSSNLRLAKRFTERDADRFKIETFEYMAKFFENSLAELAARNPGIEADFRRIDAARFMAFVYRDGKKVANCTVFLGSTFGMDGIGYADKETTQSNSFNECLTVNSDDQTLFLESLGMSRFVGQDRTDKLTQEGAAEFYWAMLVHRLQRL